MRRAAEGREIAWSFMLGGLRFGSGNDGDGAAVAANASIVHARHPEGGEEAGETDQGGRAALLAGDGAGRGDGGGVLALAAAATVGGCDGLGAAGGARADGADGTGAGGAAERRAAEGGFAARGVAAERERLVAGLGEGEGAEVELPERAVEHLALGEGA